MRFLDWEGRVKSGDLGARTPATEANTRGRRIAVYIPVVARRVELARLALVETSLDVFLAERVWRRRGTVSVDGGCDSGAGQRGDDLFGAV